MTDRRQIILQAEGKPRTTSKDASSCHECLSGTSTPRFILGDAPFRSAPTGVPRDVDRLGITTAFEPNNRAMSHISITQLVD